MYVGKGQVVSVLVGGIGDAGLEECEFGEFEKLGK